MKCSIDRRAFVTCAGVAGAAVAATCLGGCSQESAQTEAAEPAQTAAQVEAPEEVPTSDVTLQIFSGNALEKCLTLAQELYTSKTGVAFNDTQFKGAGSLIEEMKAQAPCDILIIPSLSWITKAQDADLIAPEGVINLFNNELVVIRGEGSDIEINSLEDVDSDAIERIAIGDIENVAAAKYTNEALYKVGLYSEEGGSGGVYPDSLASKMIAVDRIGIAANYCSTGDVDISFVFTSDVYRYDGIEIAYTVPEEMHEPIIFYGATTINSQNATEADKFLEFCSTDPEALQIFSEYGFEPV